jgi:hypothetical protein
MAFWPFLLWSVLSIAASYVLSFFLTKRETPETPDPAELNVPEIKEGKRYTILFGTAWIENPIIAWWGDIQTDPITQSYREPTWYGGHHHREMTVGYHYAVGIHLILTQGQMDGVKQIKAGDTLVWPDKDDAAVLQADGAASAIINEPDLFGGEEGEGGIVGTLDFQYGADAQTQNSYLVSVLGSSISATRGLSAAIARSVRFGTSPYPRGWKFLCKRTAILTDGTTQWYSSKATIDTNTLNAAHVLHECLTNTEWGLGFSSALLPSVEWEDVADTLYTEGFGICRKWESDTESIENLIKDVLRHIDGKLYQDLQTGNIILKLIRNDYDPGTLEQFDESDIIAVEDFTRGSVGEVPDMIWVRYWDMLNNVPVSILDHDIALMDQQGGKPIAHTQDFLGIVDEDLAGTIAARERQQMTSFTATMKIKTKRTMSHLRPGDVFKMSWSVLGITDMIVRIMTADFGSSESLDVTFDCVEDVFAVQTALYSPPPATGWTDPRNQPAACPDRVLREATFWSILRNGGLNQALALDDDTGFLLVSAKRPSSDAYDFELLVRESPTSSFVADGRGAFTPNGLLTADLPMNAQDATITLSSAEGLYDVIVDSYAIIDNEIVKVTATTPASDQVTIARGCLDTVPEAHNGPDSGGSGAARIWFTESMSYGVGLEFTVSDQPGVKILPRTALGQFAEGSATARNAPTFSSRMIRPYPPGDFKINGSSYPASFSGQPTISWDHRDRTQQVDEIVEHDAASIGPETNTTYTLKIYDEDNNLVRTESGLTGTSYAYSQEDEISDCGIGSGEPLNTQLRFVLYSVRDGYDSWQSYDVTVPRV